jgi:hypothetical protein
MYRPPHLVLVVMSDTAFRDFAEGANDSTLRQWGVSRALARRRTEILR